MGDSKTFGIPEAKGLKITLSIPIPHTKMFLFVWLKCSVKKKWNRVMTVSVGCPDIRIPSRALIYSVSLNFVRVKNSLFAFSKKTVL